MCPDSSVAERLLGKKEVASPILALGSFCYNIRDKPGYPSGQRGQTVNLLAIAYVGSNPSPGTEFCCRKLPSSVNAFCGVLRKTNAGIAQR